MLDRWYADPLTAADGSAPEDIAAAAARVGGRLPDGLAEWFTLVGDRLREIQDAPATPGTLRGDDAGVVGVDGEPGRVVAAGPAGRGLRARRR